MRNIFIPMQLRCARQRNKRTLHDVSNDTELSVSFLSDVERGSTMPSLKTLITLCDYYKITIDHVFSYFRGGDND
jgi:transcriptional regulator with XRE-family HTH domain